MTDQPILDPDLDTPIWGAVAMAEVINGNERKVHHLVRTKQIDVTKKGSLLVSTRRRLLKSLGVL